MSKLEFSTELGPGPEDVLVLSDGSVLTGLEDGRILRLSPDLSRFDEIAQTGGRPLGLELMPDGRVLICDARKGVFTLELGSGALTPLTRSAPPFCNNVAVARDGTVYFSSSSTRYEIEESTRDVIEARPTGSLWRCAPDGTSTCLMDGLHFANGVVLAADESHVLVAETGAARVQRYWLTGDRAGQADMLVTGLTGLPDNMSTGPDGQIWIALVAPVGPARIVWRLPFPLRWLAVRLVGSSAQAQRLQVLQITPDGEIVRHIDLTDAGYQFVTGVRAHDDALYFGSIAENRIARMELGKP